MIDSIETLCKGHFKPNRLQIKLRHRYVTNFDLLFAFDVFIIQLALDSFPNRLDHYYQHWSPVSIGFESTHKLQVACSLDWICFFNFFRTLRSNCKNRLFSVSFETEQIVSGAFFASLYEDMWIFHVNSRILLQQTTFQIAISI